MSNVQQHTPHGWKRATGDDAANGWDWDFKWLTELQRKVCQDCGSDLLSVEGLDALLTVLAESTGEQENVMPPFAAPASQQDAEELAQAAWEARKQELGAMFPGMAGDYTVVEVLICTESGCNVAEGEYTVMISHIVNGWLGADDFAKIEEAIAEEISNLEVAEEGTTSFVLYESGEREDVFWNKYYRIASNEAASRCRVQGGNTNTESSAAPASAGVPEARVIELARKLAENYAHTLDGYYVNGEPVGRKLVEAVGTLAAAPVPEAAQADDTQANAIPTGYAMRHRTGTDIGFSWKADDERFGPQWERVPMVAAPSVQAVSIELVIQIDNLCSQIENTIYAFRGDQEAMAQARGAIAHAKKVAEPYRGNGGAGAVSSDAGELPTLPEESVPYWTKRLYTADQMRDYARAALTAHAGAQTAPAGDQGFAGDRIIGGIRWPAGYSTDPNGVIIAPSGRHADYAFGYDIGYSEGLKAIKDTVKNIEQRALATHSDAQTNTAEATVEYQYRTRADWLETWGEWTRCTADQYANYLRAPIINDWHYEIRQLGVIPPDSAQTNPSDQKGGAQ